MGFLFLTIDMTKTITEIYNIAINSSAIITDSRKVIENSVFFALSGENFNGNKFAESALEKGCNYAIIDDPVFKKSEKYILVDNVLNCLQSLALHHRRTLKIPIIGITGSNGKTTTKELVTAVLSEKYKILSTTGNLNNHIGVPLTLLSIKPEHEIAVIEMGANHPGEIADLCLMTRPTHGLITNIGKAHLEGFENIDTIIKTKNALFESLTNEGVAFVNKSDALLYDLSKNLKRFFYTTSFNEEFSVCLADQTPFLKLNLNIQGKTTTIKTNLYGAYNIYNFAAAACIGNYFKVEAKLIKKAFEHYIPSNNRSQFIETKNNSIFLDAYNANPSSMTLAIKEFASQNFPSKVVIIGDMKELGSYSQQEHLNILSDIEKFKFDCVYLVGTEFSKIKNKKHLSFLDVESLKIHLENHPITNSHILIKASRSIGLEKVLSVFTN
ncbi:MAG: UDP-N-acetylmuramoyl-tripeptide--D-alanyl-D-alanine ligase [Bacteroidales bacterium]|nr:UDP-N-acetylmuramoyl-tripeptide--D-alanyl-D-alanine ligase [Bacteroidales bacterium]